MTLNTPGDEDEKKVSFKDDTDTKDKKVEVSSNKLSKSQENNEDKYKKVKVTLNQGYDYVGEKSDIGVILALKNE